MKEILAADAPATPAHVPSPPEGAPAVERRLHDGRVGVPLGKLAVDEGLVTQLQLAGAFSEQFSTGKRIGEILQARGLLTDADVARLLAVQKGLRFVDNEATPDFSELSREESARLRAVVVTLPRGGRAVAVADPDDGEALAHVQRELGSDVAPAVVSPRRLAALLGLDLADLAPPSDLEHANPAPSPEADAGANGASRASQDPSQANGTSDRADNGAVAAAVTDGLERTDGALHDALAAKEQEKKLAAAEATLGDERQTTRDLEARLLDATAQLEAAKQDLAAAHRAKTELERDLSDTTAELERRVAEATTDSAAVDRGSAEATAEIDALRHELAAARSAEEERERHSSGATAELERRLEAQAAELATTKQGLDNGRSAATELERTLGEITAEVERRFDERAAEAAGWERQLKGAHAAAAEADRRLDARTIELATATHELERVRRAAVELERGLSEANAELVATRHELDAERAAKADLERRRAETAAEQEQALAQATADLQQRLDAATRELAATRLELDATRNASDAELAALRADVAQRETRDGELLARVEGLTLLLTGGTPAGNGHLDA